VGDGYPTRYEKRVRAAAKGRAAKTARQVAVAPIREAFLRSGIGPNDLARRLGWMRPDGRRVRRVLGIEQRYDGQPLQQHVEPRIARQIADALGLDPVDLDF